MRTYSYFQMRMSAMEYYSSTFDVLVEWIKESASGMIRVINSKGVEIEKVEVPTRYVERDEELELDDDEAPVFSVVNIASTSLTMEAMEEVAEDLKTKYILDYGRVLS